MIIMTQIRKMPLLLSKNWIECASSSDEIAFSKSLTSSDAAIITTIKREALREDASGDPTYISPVNALSRKIVEPFETAREPGETFVEAMRRAKGLPTDKEKMEMRKKELQSHLDAARAPNPPEK